MAPAYRYRHPLETGATPAALITALSAIRFTGEGNSIIDRLLLCNSETAWMLSGMQLLKARRRSNLIIGRLLRHCDETTRTSSSMQLVKACSSGWQMHSNAGSNEMKAMLPHPESPARNGRKYKAVRAAPRVAKRWCRSLTDTAWPNSTRISCRVVVLAVSGGAGDRVDEDDRRARRLLPLTRPRRWRLPIWGHEHGLHGCVVIGWREERHRQTVACEAAPLFQSGQSSFATRRTVQTSSRSFTCRPPDCGITSSTIRTQ